MKIYKQIFQQLKIDGSLLSKITIEDLEKDFGISNITDCSIILQSLSNTMKFKEAQWSSLIIKCSNDHRPMFFNISKHEFSIGSNPHCEICIPGASDVHCIIKYESTSNRFFVQDLHTETGTYLQMQKYNSLTIGMNFYICGYKFVVKNIWHKLGEPYTCKLLLHDGREIEFGASGCSIGRNRRNNVILDNNLVGSVHAFINSEFALECIQDCYLRLNTNLYYPLNIGSVLKIDDYHISFDSLTK